MGKMLVLPGTSQMEADGKPLGWDIKNTESGQFLRYGNEGYGSFVQPITIAKETADGVRSALWDQMLFLQRVGGVSVVLDSETRNIGLVQPWRPQAIDQELYAKQIAKGPEYVDFSNIGMPTWETPRGMPNHPGANLENFESGFEAAIREAAEETQHYVLFSRQIGSLVPDSAFYPHRIAISLSIVDSNRAANVAPDELEKIFKVDYFTRSTVQEMALNDEISCSMTKSAMYQLECFAQKHGFELA